jgi:hypothetical protein
MARTEIDEIESTRKRKRSRVISDSVFVGSFVDNKEPRTVTKKKLTFADIVKETDHRKCVVIKPKEGAENDDNVFESLKKNVDPMGIELKRVKKVSNGGVLVECNNENSLAKLKIEVNNKIGSDIEIKNLDKFSVRMKLLGMSDDLQKTEIDEKLRKYNPSLRDLEFKTVYKYENKKKNFYKYNAIIESDIDTFKKLVALKTVTIGFDICVIVPDYDIMRCFKCCGYNHKSENCKSKLACWRCGGQHKYDECEKNGENYVYPEKCINCIKFCDISNETVNCDHRAWSKSCTIHQRKIQRQKENVNSLLK